MLKKKILNILCSFFLIFDANAKFDYDVSIVGSINFQCSIFRLPVVWIDILKKDLKVNFVKNRPYLKVKYDDLKNSIIKVIDDSNESASSGVSVFLDLLWDWGPDTTTRIPASLIKIAYSMLESSTIPHEWVNKLNSKFDAVVVPDQFLVPIYKSAGVKIPIFVLPIAMYLKEFANHSKKEYNPQDIFTFGTSAVFGNRKNLLLLIEAFHKEFNNDPKVKLILHGRYEETGYLKKMQDLIKALSCKNVELLFKRFSQKEYIDFMSKINCMVLLSRGEGFSITPYEALALETPCILSNNTAHTTICKTGFVEYVNTPIFLKAYYPPFKKYCGYQKTCTITDAQKALRNVYHNYPAFLQKAKKSKSWVLSKSINSLRPFYVSLIKPKKVILGNKNSIEKNYIITNNRNLYNKYSTLISSK